VSARDEAVGEFLYFPLCTPCVDGIGEECHTPGCAAFMHAVDIPFARQQGIDIRRRVITDPAETEALPPGAVVLAGSLAYQRKDDPSLAPFSWESVRGSICTARQLVERGPVTVLFDPEEEK
jgi:hypothetical protein